MLSVEKWPAGVALRWGADPYWRGTYTGNMIVRCDRDTAGRPSKAHYLITGDEAPEFAPASYTFLGREPREGELAVLLGRAENNVIADAAVMTFRRSNYLGLTWNWAGGGHGGWAHEDIADLLAPIDRSIYEAARGKCAGCGEPMADPERHLSEWPARLPPLRPLGRSPRRRPAPCRRRAAVERAVEEDWALHVQLRSTSDLAPIIAFADRWRGRLAELSTDCGDCPPCAAREQEMEAEDERAAEHDDKCARCGFGWSRRCGGGR